jgi:hypothetical protein
VYAVFSVSAVGVSGSFPISETSFYVRVSDGTRYQQTSTIGFGSDLNSTNLGPQEPIKGNIVFDLPWTNRSRRVEVLTALDGDRVLDTSSRTRPTGG